MHRPTLSPVPLPRGTAVAGVVAIALAVVACGGPPPSAPAPVKPDPVEHGRWLVAEMGCGDCHTPKRMGPQGPEPDPAWLLAGHRGGPLAPPPPPGPADGPWIIRTNPDLTAWSGPWGISYAINLTPDENSGIGIWTEQMFVDAMRQGKHMGTSRPILPPMPWQTVSALGDDDLKAIYAYLRSIPPISNPIPDPVIAPGPPPGGGA